MASSSSGNTSLADSEEENGAAGATVGVRRYEMDGYKVNIPQFSAHIEKELLEGRPFHVWSNMIVELANGILGSHDIRYELHGIQSSI